MTPATPAAPAPSALQEQLATTRSLLVRTRDRQALLDEACRVAVQVGGFRMAWIGWVDDGGAIVPVAEAGHVDGYLDTVRITRHGHTGAGPSGSAAREGHAVVCHDIATDPAMAPWREAALARGYRASAALPLQLHPEPVRGLLAVYADDPGLVDVEAVAQLQALALDVGFAVQLRDEEDARRQADQRYRDLFDRALEGIFRTGVDGAIVELNPAMASILGYDSPDQLRAEVARARDLYVDPRQREELLARLAEAGEVQNFEIQQRRRDGRPVWLSLNARQLHDDDGHPVGLEGLATDVTARRASQLEIQRRDAILAAVSETAEVLLTTPGDWRTTLERELGRLATAAGADRAGVIELVEADGGQPAVRRPHAWAADGVDPLRDDPRLDGLSYEAAGYGPWAVALAAGQVLDIRVDELDPAQRELLEALGTRTLLFAPIHVDGTWWGAISLEAVRTDRAWSPAETDALAAAGRVLGAAIAHERAQAELAARDRHLTDILQAVPLGVTYVDANGHITYANDRAEEILRLARSSLAGRTYDDPAWQITDLDGGPFPGRDLPFARVAAERATVRDVEHAITHPDGTRTQLSVTGVPLVEGDGTFTGMVATIEDITARRTAEVVRTRLAAIVGSSSDAIIATTPAGVVTDWNRGAGEVYGHPAPDTVGRHLSLVVPADRREEFDELHARVRAGNTVRSHVTERVRADGERIWVSLTLSPIVDPNGAVVGISTIGRDVTEEVLAREELARYATDLERSNRDLEQFAYVASHDLQEPLRMVTSFLQLLARRYEGELDEQADTWIAFAVDGASRMRQLIHDLLQYSRVGTRGAPFAPVDLDTVARQVLDDLQAAIAEADAHVEVGPLPAVTGDATQLHQLLANLVANAVKFRGDHSPRVRVTAAEGDDAWTVTVTDDGLGIPTEHHDRVFMIFQRLHSRADYPGTGMGLAICKRIVERHGGRIWIEPADGAGTTIHFTLPHVPQESIP